jgi:hypothetical protein
MNTLPTGLDTIASIVAIIVAVLSGLTLFGMGILMAVGAVFSKRPLVTSWPAEQEHSFAAFEQRSSSATSQAWVLGLFGGVLFAVFAIGVYVGVTPDMRDISKTMNMSNLTKKQAAPPPKSEAAPATTPAPSETPAATPDPATAPEAPKQ